MPADSSSVGAGAGAVFLSYASQDAEAARRICEALRAAGVEVWFDQSELRGGDAWDQKIRRQIHECSLFLPVISQHTQARAEGYFRREWKLGVGRTQDMAEDVPFIVPVVIDSTPDTTARVPDKFREVQWTRLPHGAPSLQFVEQVTRLLAMPHKPEVQRSEPKGRKSESRAAPVRSGLPGWAWAALTAVVISGIAGAFFATHKSSPAPPARESPSAAVTDRSIAVLPFANMSEDREANAFFADGMHEDVITNLALIRELRVISRTTVETYRGSQKPLRQIAGELGVAYILEGSVRRAGQKVRVTGQLIDARTDEHVWAKAYDRDLSDIFAIQAELAQAIATALQAALSPQEKSLLERRPTDNLAAYDLYLKARERRNNEGAGPDAVRRQEPLIESAVTLDPNFAVAWADLAFIHGVQYGGYTDHTPARAAQAKAALDHAVRLAPDAPETIRESGDYRCDVLRDYAGAVEQYERLLRLRPSDAHAYWSLGKIYRELGQWRESAANLHRATQLDPASFSYGGDLVALLWGCRRYDEALTEQRRLTARGTAANFNWRRALGMLTFAARGSTGEMEAFLATQQKEQGITPRLTVARKEWARARGDFPEAIRLDRLQAYYRGAHDDLTLDGEATQASDAALTLAAVGDRAAARARLGNLPVQIRARLELEPENAVFWSTLGPMEAMLENREEAERCARRAVELLPESRSQWSSVAPRCNQVIVLAWIGERDRALAELSSLMETSPLAWRMSVHHLKHGPWLYPLRDDPRYQALLDSPKSNAPLF